MRHDAARQVLHVNQLPVIARKKKQAALARAVVRGTLTIVTIAR
jgi:hypothetical protein